jgi:hypothetical protein
MVNRLPFPTISSEDQDSIAATVRQIVDIVRSEFESDETARNFVTPFNHIRETLKETARYNEMTHLDRSGHIASLVNELESKSQKICGLTSADDEVLLSEIVGPSVFIKGEPINSQMILENAHASETQLISDLLYKLGKGARYITKHSQLIDRRLELLAHLCDVSVIEVINTLKAFSAYTLTDTLRYCYKACVICSWMQLWPLGHSLRNW